MKNTELVLGEFFNVLPDAVIMVDSRGNIVFANEAVNGLLGYAADELVDQPLGILIPENFRDAHASHVLRFRDQGKATAMGARPLLSALHKSGHEKPISISIANLDLEGQRYSIAVLRDAGDLHSQIADANAQAETDALTGIGNRLRLSRAMQAAFQTSSPFGLLFLDLKKFKPFNDTYGHETGDKVLQIVARRLLTEIRSQDTAVRLGGDEFVVLLADLADRGLLQQRAATLARSVSQPIHLGELTSEIGVNIGGAIYPCDGDTEAGLLKIADQNMYRAKQAGVDYHLAD
ncbi:MAG: diguanylate cyclase [Gammaproteobacteria bacterium]|nr:MAG: diguanylate cyclase [Gammaproteobacteria bacterium]